jgi:hypothetical protein
VGKIICVSIPQRFPVERRYINTLLKLTFYAHALRRFDKPAPERARDNLVILWADEAQKIVTASDDGMSDYNVVDVLREARATVVAATQSYASLIPPMGDERKAKVFIANMANRITFCAADEDSAKIAADTLGKRKSKRRTYGYTGGKRSSSYTEEDKYFLEPHELRRLKKFQAVVQHCDFGFRKVTIPALGTDGRVPSVVSRRSPLKPMHGRTYRPRHPSAGKASKLARPAHASGRKHSRPAARHGTRHVGADARRTWVWHIRDGPKGSFLFRGAYRRREDRTDERFHRLPF